jgi:signal transduction histidine kinase
MLARITRATLAGIRVVDSAGVVVATGREGLGTSLAGREEVASALRGAPSSVLRKRATDQHDPPYAALSRETGFRVSLALPVLEGDRVWGAVLVSRTPMTIAKAVWADRWHLLSRVLVLLAVVALVSVAAAAFVARPIRALVGQARSIGRGEPAGFRPIRRPVVAELAELSRTLTAMAVALRDRSDYIRTFAANVSHEFKTPLASIQGAVELLVEPARPLTAEQRDRFLRNLWADARRLTRLVEKLLELARADVAAPGSGSVDAPPALHAIAERAVAEGASVTIGPMPPRLYLAVPQDVLDAVIRQLIANARQHGGTAVPVEIAIERLDAERSARVVVRDGGPGVSEANRARVFDAFFTTARDRGGTGLGLTIARSLLRPFGGRLDLLPPDGRGAAFAATIPLC